MKTCRTCSVELPLESYHQFKQDGRINFRSDCKDCHRTRQREAKKQWYHNVQTPDQKRRRSIRQAATKLKLDPDVIEAYYNDHAGKCDICGGSDPSRRLVVDHCHQTGAFRGLLCNNCNVGIGYLRDSPTILARASEYLTRQ